MWWLVCFLSSILCFSFDFYVWSACVRHWQPDRRRTNRIHLTSSIFHLLHLISFNSSLITQPTSNNANSATVSPTNQSRRFGLKVSTLTNQTNQFDLKSGSVQPTSSLAESISDTASLLLLSLTTSTANLSINIRIPLLKDERNFWGYPER